MYLNRSNFQNTSICQKYCFNNPQIYWGEGEGIINKCRLKTRVEILELQSFYITINSICLFYQIFVKIKVDIPTRFTLYAPNDSEHKHYPT